MNGKELAKVILRNGAKKGANQLLGVQRLPDIIIRSCLPMPLCNERSLYIEDILCTFKDAFLPKKASNYRSIEEILSSITSI